MRRPLAVHNGVLDAVKAKVLVALAELVKAAFVRVDACLDIAKLLVPEGIWLTGEETRENIPSAKAVRKGLEPRVGRNDARTVDGGGIVDGGARSGACRGRGSVNDGITMAMYAPSVDDILFSYEKRQ